MLQRCFERVPPSKLPLHPSGDRPLPGSKLHSPRFRLTLVMRDGRIADFVKSLPASLRKEQRWYRSRSPAATTQPGRSTVLDQLNPLRLLENGVFIAIVAHGIIGVS